MNNAFGFNAYQQQAVTIPDSPTLQAPAFSVEAWVNPSSPLNYGWDQTWIFGQSRGRQMVVRQGTLGLKVFFLVTANGSYFPGVGSSGEIPINEWTHLVGTWDGVSALQLYVNGAPDTLGWPGIVPWDSVSAFFAGGVYDTGIYPYQGQYFNGLIDELTYYSRALTASEVQGLYNAGAAGKCVLPPLATLVIAWGQTDAGQCNVPAGLSNVVAVAAGDRHSLALRSDGTIVGWGDNSYGQSNGLSNTVAIAASWYQSAAVLAGGRVTNWGQTYGTLPILTNAVAISAGAEHVLALLRDGTLAGWGEAGNPATNLPPGLGQVKAIASGWHHNLALLPDGTVTAWGLNPQLYGYPTNVPAGLSNVIAVAAGAYHSLALRLDGTVVAWGYNVAGQTNVPPSATNVAAIAAGASFSLALKADGTLVAWGDTSPGLPTQLPQGLNQVMAIGAGSQHALAIRPVPLPPVILQEPANTAQTNGGSVIFQVSAAGLAPITYQWQINGVNIAGATSSSLTLSGVNAGSNGNYSVVATTTGGSITSSLASFTLITPPTIVVPPQSQWVGYLSNATLTVTANAPAQWAAPLQYQWQFYGTNLPGATSTNYTISYARTKDDGSYTVVVSNLAGSTNPAARVGVLTPGRSVGWGDDDHGQSDCPAALTNTLAVAAGLSHTLALAEGGAVAAWGDNGYGQTNVPTGLTNTTAVACGARHSLALRADGTVAAWGDNSLGQTTVPSGLTNAVAIAAGWYHNLALLKSGGLTNWGKPIGSVPSNLTNATAISAGLDFSLALRSDGTVAAWGTNTYGQTTVPGGLNNVVVISAGASHCLALKQDGTVVGWGNNSSGAINVPAGLSNVFGVAAGSNFSLALRNDGTVVAWGSNTSGQTNVPNGLLGVKSVAAGGSHAVSALFSPFVQYPVNVTNDVLLIYNTTSLDSSNVCAYYLQHRPMVSGANVLGITCPTDRFSFFPYEYTNQLATPVQAWLAANPTKRPQYVILFLGIPWRVNTNALAQYDQGNWASRESVQYQLNAWCAPGWHPFVTAINMRDNDTNQPATNACIAYINKLAALGTNTQPVKIILSARAKGYSNTNFVFDDVRYTTNWKWCPQDCYPGVDSGMPTAVSALANMSRPDVGTTYAGGSEDGSLPPTSPPQPPHITSAVNVAGYMTWGEHSLLSPVYATDGVLRWQGDSDWYLIETAESYNGQPWGGGQGDFFQWFSINAFGGT